MKILLMVPVMLLSILFTQRAHAQPACDEQSARVAVRAYVLSMPLYLAIEPEEFQSFISSNTEAFTETGAATRCMLALGNTLAAQRQLNMPESEPYAAQERFGGQMPEGLGDLPKQIDESMGSRELTPSELGMEFQWLARALPSAAKGDYTLLSSTGTPNRQMMVEVLLPSLSQLCQVDVASCQSMIGMVVEIRPVLEEQLLEYVLRLGN